MNNDQERQPAGSSSAHATPHKTTKNMLPAHASKKQNKLLFWRHIHLSRTQWILVGTGTLVLLAATTATAIALYHHFHKPAPANTETPVVEEEQTSDTVASPLTGVQVKPKLAKRPVTGIMIENSPDARPQSGLQDAGIVFEAIAEGGITRFLALYQEAQPNFIGPVRSVRPYFLDWAMGYHASIAHVGGAPQALIDIRTFHARDLDQFYNAQAYWRIEERYAPHNMYTKMSNLDQLNKAKGYTNSKFDGFARKQPGEDLPAKKAKSIDFAISGYLYNVHYVYNAKTNSYLRSEGGVAHKDWRSNKQLSPDVVVAFVIPRGISSDGEHTNYTTTGSGVAYVFQDGRVARVRWKKSGRTNEFHLIDANGDPFKLNPGQTWLTAVDSVGSVNFKP